MYGLMGGHAARELQEKPLTGERYQVEQEIRHLISEPLQNQQPATTERLTDALASRLEGRWQTYREARRIIEQEWLNSLRAFDGVYSAEQQAIMEQNEHKSSTYLKITKTKVKAAYSRITDLLFQNDDSYWSIVASPLADLPLNIRTYIRNMAMQQVMGFDGLDAETLSDLIDQRVDELTELAKSQAQEGSRVAAEEMRRQIKDYIVDGNVTTQLKQAVLEMCIIGTGAFKKASVKVDKSEKWQQGGDGNWQLEPVERIVPSVEPVSCFNLWPNPHCFEPDDVDDCFRRHVLSRAKFRALKDAQGFNAEKIEQVIMQMPRGNHEDLDFERSLLQMSEQTNTLGTAERYDVLEYWGSVDGNELAKYGVEGVEPETEYAANIWTCSGYVIMARLNPLKPSDMPYLFVPYERAPHRFWGYGIPKMMEDAQDIMNASIRATLDNMAITSGPLVEIDVSMIPDGASREEYKKLHPWKVFLRDGGDGQYPMVRVNNIQANTNQLIQLLELARRFADEETSLPSYTHGEQTESLNKTASGMSMLMTAANIALKDVIKNIDDFLVRPLIKSFYHFTMEWSDNEKAKRGDFDVVAQGSISLVAKELQAQQYQQLLGETLNPVDAQLIDRRHLWKERFRAMDIDTDKAMPEPTNAAAIGPMGASGTGPAPQPGMGQPHGLPQGQAGPGNGQPGPGVGPG